MKITLILASAMKDPLRNRDPFMPLSLPLLAATAPEHEYKYIDLLWEDRVDFNEKVDIVGISVRVTAQERAFKIADEFRRRGVIVILGGPQISAEPLKAKRHSDVVVVGEGEQLWPIILKDAEKSKLRDYYICSPKSFNVKNASVFQIKDFADLKGIPHAMRNIYKRKYSFDTVFAVRGCPVNCDFCSVSSLFGKQYRTRPVEDVVAEINTFKNFYYLLDDSVFGKPPIYDYYIKLYNSISKLKNRRYWTGQANLDAVASEKGRTVIKKAAESGLIYTAIGIESINPVILEKSGSINKMGIKKSKDIIKQIKENILFIQNAGIAISGWFVVGYEEDDIETYYRTLEFCKETKILPVIFPIRALPGTRLYNRLKRENRLDNSKFINFIHPNISSEDAVKAMKYILNDGYSIKQLFKRTKFYFNRFKKSEKNMHDAIYKTIFTFILQTKLKEAVNPINFNF